MQSKPFKDLLNKRVSRREFLTYAGAGLLAATGIYGVIKNLSSMQKSQTQGYGTSVYGGKSSSLF